MSGSRGNSRVPGGPSHLSAPPPAIAMLKDKEPGSFIVRDSHSFRGAYGLAMKVATPPAFRPAAEQERWVSGRLRAALLGALGVPFPGRVS